MQQPHVLYNTIYIHMYNPIVENKLLTFLPKNALLPCECIAAQSPELNVLYSAGHQRAGGVGVELDIEYLGGKTATTTGHDSPPIVCPTVSP